MVEKASWRWVFWIIPMLAMPAALAIMFFLPLAYKKGDYLNKAKKIDFGGIVINLAGVLLILVSLIQTSPLQTSWSGGLTISLRSHLLGEVLRTPGTLCP